MSNSEEWSPEARAMEQAMVALGDQVQQAIDNSGLPVGAFVLIAATGNTEYRTRWGMDALKQVLFNVAEDL
jgi:hypothetical protein